MKIKQILILAFTLIFLYSLGANAQIGPKRMISHLGKIGDRICYYADKNHTITDPRQIPDSSFTSSYHHTLNFQFTKTPYWIRFKVAPFTSNTHLYLRIANPNLDKVSFYYYDKERQLISKRETGESHLFKDRDIQNEEFIFELPRSNTDNIYYLRVTSSGQLQIPLFIEDAPMLNLSLSNKNLLTGIYLGIMLVMAIYNLFIYTVIRDRSYLWYVSYIATTTLIQCDALGLCYRFLWPSVPRLNSITHLLFPVMVGIISLNFFYQFLNFKQHNPKLRKYINTFTIIYLTLFALSLSKYYQESYLLIQILALCASTFVLYHSGKLALKGDRAAFFFIIAWGVFLSCVILFVLRNFNIVPYNMLTNNILQIGSAIEVVLLSFALADKINTYREDKELSQLETIRISEENSKLIFEQNIILEKRVEERTTQLQELNTALEGTLSSLKETQSQLVDSEKMASLGQLTAGIAHEINNPINFVTSNIKPLEMDIQDLNDLLEQYDNITNSNEFDEAKAKIEKFKKEIDVNFLKEEIKILLSGIQEGAIRTAEIVKSLKTFSRLDESDMKLININEGLDSTLVLIRNMMPKELILIKELGDIPKIECLGGKLNQVFMNLITNAIQAVKMKESLEDKEYLTVKTYQNDNYVCISIKDTGIGVPDEIKHKIYEPFFSTKEVGEGTGLGLSIVRSIIESHQGKIDLISETGKGSEFVISLPLKK